MVNLLSYYHDDEHALSSWLYLKNYGKNMSEWLNVLKLFFRLFLIEWSNHLIAIMILHNYLPWLHVGNYVLEYKNFYDNKHVLPSWL